MTSDRESVEKRLHDRIDDLVRELNEAERRLAENMLLNAVNLEITRKAVQHSNAVLECLRRVMGTRVSAPIPSAEQIENDRMERRGGR